MITTLTRPKMIPLLRMETLKSHTLLVGTYLSQWRMQTFRWEGRGGHPKPLIRGGEVGAKFFSAPRASVWSNDNGVGGGGSAPLDPPLYLAHIWEYAGI